MLQTMTNLLSFQTFFDHVLDFQCEDLIIGEDFNLVVDLVKTKKGGLAKTHTESVKVLQIVMVEHNLMDTWRILNPTHFSIPGRGKKQKYIVD